MLLRVDQYLQINCKTQETLTNVSESRGGEAMEPPKGGTRRHLRGRGCYCVLLAAVIVLYFLPSFIFI